MISRVSDSRLDEQRSPPPSNILGSPIPPPSPAPPAPPLEGGGPPVPRYILATSTPHDQHPSHLDRHGDDKDSTTPILSRRGTPPDHIAGMVGGASAEEVRVTIPEGRGEREGMVEEEEEGRCDGGGPFVAAAGTDNSALELDLSVSSVSGSHLDLTGWEGEEEDQLHPLPTPPPPHDEDSQLLHSPSNQLRHHHHHRASNSHDNSSSAHLPHPLEYQQRRQSWFSDMWDDSSGSVALSFSASLGFEPSSFGKMDHRWCIAGLAPEEEEGAEL